MILRNLILLSLSFSLHSMEMMVFNVGQGNCTVVKHPTEPTLLIDAGSAKLPLKLSKEKIIKAIIHYILKDSPKSLIIVVSHAHLDHYGWIPTIGTKLQKELEVTLILGGTASDYKTPIYKKLIALKKKVHGVCVDETTTENLSKLLPNYCTLLASLTNGPAHNPNCRSMVLYINDLATIIPGDATGKTTDTFLKQLPLLETAFLIVPHHGSDTDQSNSKKFLEATHADFCIISSGLKHNHPRPSVIKRIIATLKDNAPVYYHSLTYPTSSTKLIEERLRPFISYNNGYETAITNYAIYTTVDMGNLQISQKKDGTLLLQFPNKPPRSLDILTCMMKTLQSPPLENTTQIDLSKTPFNESHIHEMELLPRTLHKLDVSNTQIGINGIMWLLYKLISHKLPITLKMEHVGFTVECFEWLLYHHQDALNTLLRKWMFVGVISTTEDHLAAQELRSLHFSTNGHGGEETGYSVFVPVYIPLKDDILPIERGYYTPEIKPRSFSQISYTLEEE